MCNTLGVGKAIVLAPLRAIHALPVPPSASDDHHARFLAATIIDLADQHPMLRKVLRQLLQAALPGDLQSLLPDIEEGLSSVVTKQLREGKPMSLSAMRRRANRVLHEATSSGAPRPQPHPWNDPAGYVRSYRAIVESPDCPVLYSRAIPMSKVHSPFPLPAWWEAHAPGCSICSQHEATYGGVLAAILHNHHNECWLADVLAWLAGQWRIPVSGAPVPARRPNHPSLLWSPLAMRPEVQRMLEWGVLTRQPPTIVNPCMAVVKESDVVEQCRLAEALGRPCPSSQPQDVEAINHHILELKGEGVRAPPDMGVLKEIKVRFCIDLSSLVNPFTFKWPFSYASCSDLVALVGPGWYMAKLDLERFFNQLPLHEEDQPLLGARLPAEILPDDLLPELLASGEDGMDFSSGFAQVPYLIFS